MAAHIQEQEELENFKYFWNRWGRWLFGILAVAALVYFGYTLYQSHQSKKSQQAAGILAQLVEKYKNHADTQAIDADLQNLKQNYGNTVAAAQAVFIAASSDFDQGSYDTAASHLKWVLQNQSAPVIKALATQRLAVVQLQQKQYDEALATLNTQTIAAFEPLFLETKGDVYAAQGKKQEALQIYGQLLERLPQDSHSRVLIQLKAEQLK